MTLALLAPHSYQLYQTIYEEYCSMRLGFQSFLRCSSSEDCACFMYRQKTQIWPRVDFPDFCLRVNIFILDCPSFQSIKLSISLTNALDPIYESKSPAKFFTQTLCVGGRAPSTRGSWLKQSRHASGAVYWHGSGFHSLHLLCILLNAYVILNRFSAGFSAFSYCKCK